MRRAAVVAGIGLATAVAFVAPTNARAALYNVVQRYVGPKKLTTIYFGSSVAIVGDRIAIGSPIVVDQEPEEAGALFLYDRATAEVLSMVVSPGAAEDNY